MLSLPYSPFSHSSLFPYFSPPIIPLLSLPYTSSLLLLSPPSFSYFLLLYFTSPHPTTPPTPTFLSYHHSSLDLPSPAHPHFSTAPHLTFFTSHLFLFLPVAHFFSFPFTLSSLPFHSLYRTFPPPFKFLHSTFSTSLPSVPFFSLPFHAPPLFLH